MPARRSAASTPTAAQTAPTVDGMSVELLAGGVGVRHDAGTYTAVCKLCTYTGTPQAERGLARAAAAHHATGLHHRRALRRAAIRR